MLLTSKTTMLMMFSVSGMFEPYFVSKETSLLSKLPPTTLQSFPSIFSSHMSSHTENPKVQTCPTNISKQKCQLQFPNLPSQTFATGPVWGICCAWFISRRSHKVGSPPSAFFKICRSQAAGTILSCEKSINSKTGPLGPKTRPLNQFAPLREIPTNWGSNFRRYVVI